LDLYGAPTAARVRELTSFRSTIAETGYLDVVRPTPAHCRTQIKRPAKKEELARLGCIFFPQTTVQNFLDSGI